jgi:hypothetical protein
MLSIDFFIVVLNVIMLSAIMLSVILLSVVAPPRLANPSPSATPVCLKGPANNDYFFYIL